MNNKLTLKVKLLIFWLSLKSPFNKNVFVELNKMAGSWVMVVIAFIVMYFYYLTNRYRYMKEDYIKKKDQYIKQLKITKKLEEMNLNELRDKIHENAKAKGFYDTEKSIINFGVGTSEEEVLRHAFFAQKIALIHSELSEALEADRKGKHASLNTFLNELNFGAWDNKKFEILVKNSIEDELADVIIRTLDLCGYLGIDIEKHVELKMRYNEQREYKHGKNY